jgi:hypothetical protein
MMKFKHIFPLSIAVLSLAFLLSNCAALSGLQDGKTLGKGVTELNGSINVNSSPDFNKLGDRDTSTFIGDIPSLFLPYLEFGARYGVTDKVDITLRLNTFLNLGVGAKFQVAGNQESKVALALGAEVGTFGLISGLWNVQVPVYFSLHPTEKFTWYLSPRYIYQFTSYSGLGDGLSYTGGNTGLLFGSHHKFGIDFGFYNLSSGDDNTPLIQVGLGGKFILGGD